MHRCPVGKAEYTPPELQGAPFGDFDRGPEHDAFGLAVLTFQLLMQGVHPFAGRFTAQGEPQPLDARIRAGHWPYCQKRCLPYVPSPHAPPFAVLPPQVQELLRRCFEDGHARSAVRPTAAAWMGALDAAEKEVLPSPSSPRQHVYHRSLKACPWCELERRQGRDPFPTREDVLASPAGSPAAAPRQAAMPPATILGGVAAPVELPLSAAERRPVETAAANTLSRDLAPQDDIAPTERAVPAVGEAGVRSAHRGLWGFLAGVGLTSCLALLLWLLGGQAHREPPPVKAETVLADAAPPRKEEQVLPKKVEPVLPNPALKKEELVLPKPLPKKEELVLPKNSTIRRRPGAGRPFRRGKSKAQALWGGQAGLPSSDCVGTGTTAGQDSGPGFGAVSQGPRSPGSARGGACPGETGRPQGRACFAEPVVGG
jgi:hypothetical protein